MSQRSKVRDSAIAGACAGLVSSIVTCPLYVLKTRLQVQTDKASLRNMFCMYNRKVSDLALIRNIWTNDGFRGFYRGLGPTMIGYLPTWAIYFCVYDGCKKVFSHRSCMLF